MVLSPSLLLGSRKREFDPPSSHPSSHAALALSSEGTRAESRCRQAIIGSFPVDTLLMGTKSHHRPVDGESLSTTGA